MMAAYAAANALHAEEKADTGGPPDAEDRGGVVLLEKNEKLGKKVFITGKGRCNVTNACETGALFRNLVSNEKFMYSAFYGFDNYAVMDFLKKQGVR